MTGISLRYFWSRTFLLSPPLLRILFWINLLGTLYGFEWYWDQMVDTIGTKPIWMVIFVPDSPTASLFFTLSVLYLWVEASSVRHAASRRRSAVRSLIETVAAVTSFKYGIWAVAMILAGAWRGSPIGWEDWMLSLSHLAMAAEAICYLRFFRIGNAVLVLSAIWCLGNDFVDYHDGVFPWLPKELADDIPFIQWFTVGLSMVSLMCIWLVYKFYPRERV